MNTIPAFAISSPSAPAYGFIRGTERIPQSKCQTRHSHRWKHFRKRPRVRFLDRKNVMSMTTNNDDEVMVGGKSPEAGNESGAKAVTVEKEDTSEKEGKEETQESEARDSDATKMDERKREGSYFQLEGEPEIAEGTFLEEKGAFWNKLDVMEKPLTEKEKEIVMKKLPGPIARFLIRRAEGSEKGSRKGFLDAFGSSEPFYSEEGYQYEPFSGEQLKSNGEIDEDELWDPTKILKENVEEDEDAEIKTRPKKRRGLFMGKDDVNRHRAEDVGMAAFGLLFLFIGGKLFFSLVTFFLSFSFSFLAIFALSAGIFFVFYILNF